jgi:hypothetical protein
MLTWQCPVGTYASNSGVCLACPVNTLGLVQGAYRCTPMCPVLSTLAVRSGHSLLSFPYPMDVSSASVCRVSLSSTVGNHSPFSGVYSAPIVLLQRCLRANLRLNFCLLLRRATMSVGRYVHSVATIPPLGVFATVWWPIGGMYVPSDSLCFAICFSLCVLAVLRVSAGSASQCFSSSVAP